METAITGEEIVKTCLSFSSKIINYPVRHMWIDYDREADVLYVSFRRPQRAKETIEYDEGILIRKDGDEIVGITILNASETETDIQ